MKSFILSDFDGTLTIEGTLDWKVIKRLYDLSNLGYKVVIVTGRPLSWCNMMMNTLPINAIVGENGAGYYYNDNGAIKLKMMVDPTNQIERKNEVMERFPTLTESEDNIHRLTDFALCIDKEYLKIENQLLTYLHDKGYEYKISNIHINILSGTYDKMTSTEHMFKNVFNIEPTNTGYDSVIYFGDSLNDEPMFGKIKESIGVSNIRKFLPLLKHKPKYITKESEGNGFIEWTNTLSYPKPFDISRYAYVTLLGNSFYEKGIIALTKSLMATGTEYPLVVMKNRDFELSEDFKSQIQRFVESKQVKIYPIDDVPLTLDFISRHDFNRIKREFPYSANKKYSASKPKQFVNTLNFNKLQLWNLDYDNVVYLDADMIIIQNIDDLFDIKGFAGASNIHARLGNLNSLNSGLFVTQPSKQTFNDMMNILNSSHPDKIYKRTDQTFLDEYFPKWNRLSHTYNFLQYLYLDEPLLFDLNQIKVIHYILQKPWQYLDDESKKTLDQNTIHTLERLNPLRKLWSDVYNG